MSKFKVTSIDYNQHTVSYNGISLTIPKNTMYLTTDADGGIDAFITNIKPTIAFNEYWTNCTQEDSVERRAILSGGKVYVGQCKYQGDWKKSLVYFGRGVYNHE